MLKVNEVFGPTIQGEGRSFGKQVMFVRLAGCNLYCIWCDTPYTWNWIGSRFSHPEKFNKKNEVHDKSVQQILTELTQLGPETKAVVISGGEPLLQQVSLVELCIALKQAGYWIEIETNGTRVLHEDLTPLVDQFNCSPKLENSETLKQHRLRPEALRTLQMSGKCNFKFVVSSEKQMSEILDLVSKFNMTDVYLMAEGRTVAELERRSVLIQQLCEQYHFTYTPRLHILKFGAKRAV